MNIDTLHHFSDGLYAKQMSIPKGAIACQHKHEYDHLSVLAQGKVRVLFDDDKFETYTAAGLIGWTGSTWTVTGTRYGALV